MTQLNPRGHRVRSLNFALHRIQGVLSGAARSITNKLHIEAGNIILGYLHKLYSQHIFSQHDSHSCIQ